MKVVFCRYGVTDFNNIKTFKKESEANKFVNKHNCSQEEDYAVALSEKKYKRMKKEREYLKRRSK